MRISGATIIDGTGRAPYSGTIIIDGPTVSAIEPPGASGVHDTINAAGMFVLPGFVDAHSHLGLALGDQEAQMREPTPLVAIWTVGRALDNLRSGVTTMRTMGEKDHIDLAYRDAIDQGLIPGPRILAAGWGLTRTGGHGYFICREVDGPDQVRQAVRQNIKDGVDVIKLFVSGGGATRLSHPMAAELTFDEIKAGVEEAHDHGLKVAVHGHGGPGVDRAIEAGVDSVEHGFLLTREQLKKMADRGIYLVATLGFVVIPKPPEEEPRPAWLLDKVAVMREAAAETMAAARQVGVPIALGTDSDHGRFPYEPACLEMFGWSRMDAICAATHNGAEVCGLDDVGTIVPGNRADLVIVGNDPTANLSALLETRFVLKDGIVVHRS